MYLSQASQTRGSRDFHTTDRGAIPSKNCIHNSLYLQHKADDVKVQTRKYIPAQIGIASNKVLLSHVILARHVPI